MVGLVEYDNLVLGILLPRNSSIQCRFCLEVPFGPLGSGEVRPRQGHRHFRAAGGTRPERFAGPILAGQKWVHVSKTSSIKPSWPKGNHRDPKGPMQPLQTKRLGATTCCKVGMAKKAASLEGTVAVG